MAAFERASLRIREFLALVRDAVLTTGTADSSYQWRQRFSYVQFYRRDPRVHYEVWPQKKRGRIEIGLHFEGPREFSYAWAAVMAQHADDIMASLGPEVELEEWTPAWTRLHRVVPFEVLSQELARDAAGHVLRFMEALDPILESAWDDVLARAAGAPDEAGRPGRGRPRRRYQGRTASRG